MERKGTEVEDMVSAHKELGRQQCHIRNRKDMCESFRFEPRAATDKYECGRKRWLERRGHYAVFIHVMTTETEGGGVGG